MINPISYANRYNKPMVQVFLDILNTSNNTLFTEDELVIGEPVVVEGLLTSLSLRGINEPSDTPDTTIYYERNNLNVTFAEVGIAIDVENNTVETITQAISEQYGIYLDEDQFDFEIDDIEFVARITARPTHLMFTGDITVKLVPMVEFLGRPFKTRLKVQEYYAHGNGKLPIETLKDPSMDLDDHYSIVKQYRTGATIEPDSPLVRALASVSGLDLVSIANTVARFNLYGSTVLYNGFNDGTYRTGQYRYSHVIALQISNHWCENLNGVWLIPYTNPDAFRYSSLSVSNPPLLSTRG